MIAGMYILMIPASFAIGMSMVKHRPVGCTEENGEQQSTESGSAASFRPSVGLGTEAADELPVILKIGEGSQRSADTTGFLKLCKHDI